MNLSSLFFLILILGPHPLNTVFKNCERYQKNGIASLEKDFAAAKNQGFSCLNQLEKNFPGPLASEWKIHVFELLIGTTLFLGSDPTELKGRISND